MLAVVSERPPASSRRGFGRAGENKQGRRLWRPCVEPHPVPPPPLSLPAGQAAFGNMVRGGHMFAPNKTWRRWHRKVNLKQKRYATVSAIAATALPALVLARGHRIEQVPEVPLVIDDAAGESPWVVGGWGWGVRRLRVGQ